MRSLLPLILVALIGSTSAFAGPIRSLSHPAEIGQTAMALPTFTDVAATMQRTAVVLSLLAFWMITAVCLTITIGREVRLSSLEIRNSPLHCFVLGLVAVTSFMLTAIVLTSFVPFVGLPLLAAIGAIAVVAKIYGTIAVFHAVGSLVAAPRNRDAMTRRRWLRGDLAMVVVGGLLLGGLRLIPMIGPVAWACASVFGVGVALCTRFGRRQPWFLAWRQLETQL